MTGSHAVLTGACQANNYFGKGDTVEGMNLVGMWLACLGVLVLGITSLVALGLRIAGLSRGARLTFAGGLLGAAVIEAVATLSFREGGQGGRGVWVYAQGDDPTIVITALSLLLAGAGQFIAALRIPGSYGVAFGWAAASMVFLATPLLGADGLRMEVAEKVLGMHSLSIPAVTLGLALGLLMAVLSLVSAVVSPRKKTAALVWAALGGLGCIVGFAVGDACVTTHCSLVPVVPVGDPPRWVFQGDPSRGNTQVRVEVYVLGKRVSEEVGGASTPPELVRSVSPAQDAWVYGPLAAGAAGAAAGLVVGWVIARRLVRHSGEGGARRTTP